VYTALGSSIGDLSSPLAYSAVAVWCATAIIGAIAAHHGYRHWRGSRAGEREPDALEGSDSEGDPSNGGDVSGNGGDGDLAGQANSESGDANGGNDGADG
jgi:hypothetical protein